jgi:hypothetical protein
MRDRQRPLTDEELSDLSTQLQALRRRHPAAALVPLLERLVDEVRRVRFAAFAADLDETVAPRNASVQADRERFRRRDDALGTRRSGKA